MIPFSNLPPQNDPGPSWSCFTSQSITWPDPTSEGQKRTVLQDVREKTWKCLFISNSDGCMEMNTVYLFSFYFFPSALLKINLYNMKFTNLNVLCDVCLFAQSLSPVQLFATPWTVAGQAPLSMDFSKQEHWSRLPFPYLGIFLTQGLNLHLMCLLYYRQILYLLNHQRSS